MPPSSSLSPSPDTQGTRPSRRPVWLRAVPWALGGVVILLAFVLAGAAAFVALHASPPGDTFAWPFRVVGRTNVLVMGLDRTVSDRNPAIVYPISRTDTLIAVSFDPRAHRITALSIPRDTRAPIPGHGTQKINAAHAYGGAPLTLRTVEDFLGVPFPYYIEVTERGLVHLIDAVGGVTIRIDKDLNYDDNWDGLHIHLRKGNRRLGGMAAMEYARFRHDALGDIGRIARQQQLVNALLAELRRPRVVWRAGRILRVFREDIRTNLFPEQLVALAWFAARLPRTHLVTETLPGHFGNSDWIPDREKARDLVIRNFYGIDPGLLARETAEVLASGDAPGRADALARLEALGVRVVRVGSGTQVDSAEPVVMVHAGDLRAARAVALALRARLVSQVGPPGGPDLTVTLPSRPADSHEASRGGAGGAPR